MEFQRSAYHPEDAGAPAGHRFCADHESIPLNRYMKNLYFPGLLLVTVFSCSCNLDQEIKEAVDARKKSDSILTEFKKINDRLQKQKNESAGTSSDSTSRLSDSIMSPVTRFDLPGHI